MTGRTEAAVKCLSLALGLRGWSFSAPLRAVRLPNPGRSRHRTCAPGRAGANVQDPCLCTR